MDTESPSEPKVEVLAPRKKIGRPKGAKDKAPRKRRLDSKQAKNLRRLLDYFKLELKDNDQQKLGLKMDLMDEIQLIVENNLISHDLSKRIDKDYLVRCLVIAIELCLQGRAARYLALVGSLVEKLGMLTGIIEPPDKSSKHIHLPPMGRTYTDIIRGNDKPRNSQVNQDTAQR